MCEDCSSEDHERRGKAQQGKGTQHSTCNDKKSQAQEPQELHETYRTRYYSYDLERIRKDTQKKSPSPSKPSYNKRTSQELQEYKIPSLALRPSSYSTRRLQRSDSDRLLQRIRSEVTINNVDPSRTLKRSHKSASDLQTINQGPNQDHQDNPIKARPSEVVSNDTLLLHEQRQQKLKETREILENNNIPYNKSLFSSWESYYMNDW